LNSGSVTVYRFFDGELDGDAVWRLQKFCGDHWVDDSLVGLPFHIGFQKHAYKVAKQKVIKSD
jgi:hypothetical protein